MTGKAWYASKTIWVNVIGLAIAVAVSIGYSDATVGLVAGGVLPLVNLGLRMITGEPIVITTKEIGLKE